MPITEQVVQIVHHGMKPQEMLAAFMSRSPKAETRLS
jgi:glycerol-3-phosphate dehydrogenase